MENATVSIADIILACLLLFYFITGFRSGLFRTLIGPLAFVVCTVAAVIHFDLNRNPAKSLGIITLGTFGIWLAVNLIMFLSTRRVDKNFRNTTFLGSRLMGAAVNVAWKGFLTFFALLVITVLPIAPPAIARFQPDIESSVMFNSFLNTFMGRISLLEEGLETLSILQDPMQMSQWQSTPEFVNFFSQPRVVALRTDPEVQGLINNNDYAGLFRNPQVHAVIGDDSLMNTWTKLFLRVHRDRLAAQKTPAAAALPPAAAQP